MALKARFRSPGGIAFAGLLLLGSTLVVPLFVRPWDLHPGFLIFFAWAAFCASAAIARRTIVWALLCLVPLCAHGWTVWRDWRFVTGEQMDTYGFYPWGAITLFVGMCLVTAATGMIILLLTASDRPAAG